MIRQLIAAGFTFAISLGVCLAGPALADEGDIKARELVSEARFTIERLVADDAVGPDVRALFDDAKAIMIFPSNVKAGFLLAGEGGGGILLARADNNEWSYPAFYTMGTGSIGLQVGALESETVIFIMTGEGLEVLLDGTATFGGELNAAAGNAGETRQAATTTNFGKDIVSFGLNDGAFIGVSIEGSVIVTNESRTMTYYNDVSASSEAVVVRGEYANADADTLRALLAKLSQPAS